ncbi:MAG TPA: hypothetical protein VKQ11_05165 [Candidatus Sulfotelmatobacter sp.]|nr:hypothetical protein [Candidatus Sulfotelmatobacter sp.]
MKVCNQHVLRVCLFFLVTVPAFGQRVTLGIDAGQTSDKFGTQPSTSSFEYGIDGQVTVLKSNEKKGGPSIVAGGEILVPADAANHAKEYAIYGGPMFQAHNLTIGVTAQIRKLFLPVASFDGQVFNRQNMELLELPLTIKYNFLSSKHAFVQVQGAPEFSPRFRTSVPNPFSLPSPTLDHGYFLRGSAGYIFGKFYAKATYQTRYFKFDSNAGNPSGLYNWRTDMIMGGVGFAF